MEDLKKDKCIHKVDGNMHKNKSTYLYKCHSLIETLSQ